MSIALGIHLRSDSATVAVADGPPASRRCSAVAERSYVAALDWSAGETPRLADPTILTPTYRGFINRVGDPIPVTPSPGGPARSAVELAGALIELMIRETEADNHDVVDRVFIAHPAYWSLAQVTSLFEALNTTVGNGRQLMLGPDAQSAMAYLAEATDLGSPRRVVTVDLREDAAVIALLTRSGHDEYTLDDAHRFAALGTHGLDTAIMHVVIERLTAQGYDVPHHPAIMARLLASCTHARRALLHSGFTAVTAALPDSDGLTTHRIALTREQLDRIARTHMMRIVAAIDALTEGAERPELIVVTGAGGDIPKPDIPQPDIPQLDVIAVESGIALVTEGELAAPGAAMLAAAHPESRRPDDLETPQPGPPSDRAVRVNRIGEAALLVACALIAIVCVTLATWGAVDIGTGTQASGLLTSLTNLPATRGT